MRPEVHFYQQYLVMYTYTDTHICKTTRGIFKSIHIYPENSVKYKHVSDTSETFLQITDINVTASFTDRAIGPAVS